MEGDQSDCVENVGSFRRGEHRRILSEALRTDKTFRISRRGDADTGYFMVSGK